MLRLTRCVRLAGAPLFIPPLITEFSTAEDFHCSRSGYLADLYEPASSSDPFSSVLQYMTHYGVRLMVSAPVTIGKKCLRTPFLIDTGSTATLFHTETLRKFCLGNDIIPPELQNVKIGHHLMSVRVNTATTNLSPGDKEYQPHNPHHLGYLNLIGMDFLRVAAPQLPDYLSENLSKFQPPISYVVVTDGKMALRVTPRFFQVMDLKKAMKEESPNLLRDVDYCAIIIKSPDGIVLGDEEPLHANVKYVFELPKNR